MTQNEVKHMILAHGLEDGCDKVAERVNKQRERDSLIWLGILLFFALIFVGYQHEYGFRAAEKMQRELFREQQINLRNKQINDSLAQEMENYPVLVIDPAKKRSINRQH